MALYEDVTAFWQQKNIKTDAELAEILNGYGIAFAYHSGRIENRSITFNII